MKITISPSSLAAQLPLLRLDILQIYEDNLVLEGRPVSENTPLSGRTSASLTKEERYPILTKRPEFFTVFSTMELQLLSALFLRKELTIAGIHGEMFGYQIIIESNKVSVHLKNIENKIRNKKLTIHIKRQGHKPTYYSLIGC